MTHSENIDPVRRSSSVELFLLIIEARPLPGSQAYGGAGGAFVNCWVDADDLRAAERRAVALISEAGWRPHRFDSWEIVTRDSYNDLEPTDDDGSDLSKLVSQAFIDGEVCVIHTWPFDVPDA
ncbi:MAG: hypothetical protein WCK10_02870, partial [Candidatus Staskawiczbacteria bacterium]